MIRRLTRAILSAVISLIATCAIAQPYQINMGGESAEYPPITDTALAGGTITALDQIGEWIDRPPLTAIGHRGELVFQFGQTLPEIVCAPLYPCAVILEPGEIVTTISAGDSVRWNILPRIHQENGHAITSIVIKPLATGLFQQIFVGTDRRLYTLRLVSHAEKSMPLVSFSYPDQTSAAWSEYYAQTQMHRDDVEMPGGYLVTEMDFNYRIEGDTGWTPVRVFNDGRNTYIQFDQRISEMSLIPVLSLSSAASANEDREIVSYTVVADKFLVRRIINNAILSVAGEKAIVEITRINQ